MWTMNTGQGLQKVMDMMKGRKEGSLIYQGDNTKYEGISKTLRHDENYVDESQLLILDVVSSWICSMRRSSTHNLSKPKVQPH